MRIVIDLQGAQTESRFRGIGRYSISLAMAIAKNRGDHDVIIALSGLFPETLESIKGAFQDLLPEQNIRVWGALGPTREDNPSNGHRRVISERIREAFFADLRADVVLITSLFEGMGDDAIGSVGRFQDRTPTAVVLHDLIPLINPDINFRTNRVYKDWYDRKIVSLKSCQLLLSNSESSRQEAIVTNVAKANDVVSISGACSASFKELSLSDADKVSVRQSAGITRRFVMYTGGADERKNLARCIEAYSKLPRDILSRYQLVFVGKMPLGHIEELKSTAKKNELDDADLVFTGFVDDDLLIGLYNSCDVFIFPSLHEGLGLPPLEAMACGAPVIASNVTSLPEIVGIDQALFDPESVDEISAKLKAVLTNESFRSKLIEHGRAHVRKFSWDSSAIRAIRALERFERRTAAVASPVRIEETSLFRKAAKDILLMKLDHMGDFLLALPAISKLRARYPYANIDILVGSWSVGLAEEVQLFRNIYQFNFFKKASATAPGADAEALQHCLDSLGTYDIAIDLRRQRDTRFILLKTRSACKVGYGTFDARMDRQLDIKLEAVEDVQFESTRLNRTHITQQMISLVDALPNDVQDYVHLPVFGDIGSVTTETTVAIFPAAGNDVKQWAWDRYQELIDRLLADDRVDSVALYFGGEVEAKRFKVADHPKLRRHVGSRLTELARSLGDSTVCVANNSFGAHIASYVGCTVVGIYGGHETVAEWAPVFGDNYVIHRAAHCSPCHLPSRAECPNEMFCLDDISVESVQTLVMEAIDAARGRGLRPTTTVVAPTSAEIVDTLIESIAERGMDDLEQAERLTIARCISQNHRPAKVKRQLLIDVSELVQRDARSGIQRVVRAVLGQLLSQPPQGYVVEPVYATLDRPGYRYARAFTSRFLQSDLGAAEDSPVEVWSDDVFLGLDLHAQLVAVQGATLEDWRNRGAKVLFVVYDLIPVFFPDAFPDGAGATHQKWLETIAQFDGAMAISRSTATELKQWLDVFGPVRERPFKLGWFHLGADVRSTSPTLGLPASAKSVISAISKRPALLMVGTLEPRKGHQLVLEAFETMWDNDVQANLVIVGKRGWLVDDLVQKLRNHKEADKRLFWLEQISDEYLDHLFPASSALLTASLAEGFGLPLVEAARHGLPIVARDIPIFREVAGESAFYFPDTDEAGVLAASLVQWLKLHSRGQHPSSQGLPWITWTQSVNQLLRMAVGAEWPDTWMSDGVHRYWGADPRLSTRVGERKGTAIHSTGKEGQLIFGPYLSLKAGHYRLELLGEVIAASGAEVLDVVYFKGRRQVFRHDFDRLEKGEWRYHHEFTLSSPVKDLEIRIDVGEYAMLKVDSVLIAPQMSSQTKRLQAVNINERIA